MLQELPANTLLYGSLALIPPAVALAVWGMHDRLRAFYDREVASIDRYLVRLFLRDQDPKRIFALQWSIIAVVFFLSFFLFGFLKALAASVVVYALPRIYRKRQIKKRAKRFDDQLVDALVAIANAFKARPTLSEALTVVVENMTPPISQEFELLLSEFRLGVTIDEGLDKMSRRLENPNLSMAINAMQIARTTGGNMSEILDDIASTIREIRRLQGVVDAMTAQGRLQAWVIGSLPFGLGLIFYLIQPDLIVPLFSHPMGYLILMVQGVLWLAAIVLLRKIININV